MEVTFAAPAVVGANVKLAITEAVATQTLNVRKNLLFIAFPPGKIYTYNNIIIFIL